jgi:hypothetical protein
MPHNTYNLGRIHSKEPNERRAWIRMCASSLVECRLQDLVVMLCVCTNVYENHLNHALMVRMGRIIADHMYIIEALHCVQHRTRAAPRLQGTGATAQGLGHPWSCGHLLHRRNSRALQIQEPGALSAEFAL